MISQVYINVQVVWSEHHLSFYSAAHNFTRMDFVLSNIMNMSVSTIMNEEMGNVVKLSETLTKYLMELDPHEHNLEEYIDWNTKVEGWCDNLKILMWELHEMQMTIAQKRINRSDDEVETD